MTRGTLLELVAALPPRSIAMETSTGAHRWSIEQEGRLMVRRALQGVVEQCTASLDRIDRLLGELDIVLLPKAVHFGCGRSKARAARGVA